jgi:hypothetical protein
MLTPVAVAGMQLLGTIAFQIILYIWYGQSIFDNMDLPGADFVMFNDSSKIVRWPSQLIARAVHMWAVLGDEGVAVLLCVLAVGTLGGWAWLIANYRRTMVLWSCDNEDTEHLILCAPTKRGMA